MKTLKLARSILFNLSFWLFLWLIFGFSIMRFEPTWDSFRISALVIFPLIIPVFIHDFLFDYFIIRKRYLLYILFTTLLVLFFGYIIGELQHYLEPEGSSETYGALLFMMILYTGARYFRIGTQQRIRLKEEEEKRMKAEMELKEMEIKQVNAELNFLRSQINPHFLFNSLNSIYALILNHSELASDAVMKLSDLMRYLLDSSKKRKVLVSHEIDFLRNYIDLEKIRLGRKVIVHSCFTGDMSGKTISPLLLIPFIENCFKHGISVISSDNDIEVSVEVMEHSLKLRTSNRIAPARAGGLPSRPGTGIANVKKRLELLYPGKHGLDIQTANGMFVVNLSITI
ncbi:MAG: histidine kinase [Bacteroidales bacterium]|nr:histidine kinase [Bacteroidales bacterium]